MADLSLVMLNQVLGATLAFMILLLVMSVTAIVRVDSTPGARTEGAVDGQPIGQVPAMPAAPAPLWSQPLGSYLGNSAPPARKSGWLGRGRYEARHVRGRTPKPRAQGPAGPPWGPAAPPSGLPQQGSERWT